MDYVDGLIVGFKPRFKSFDDDWERYMFAIVDLAEAGKIRAKPGEPLYKYALNGGAWMVDQYVKAGKLDLLEAAHLSTGSASMNPPPEGTLALIDRFCSLGQTERARRIWRSHISGTVSHFWELVHHLKKGVDTKTHWSGDLATAQEDHDKLNVRVAEDKPRLINLMAQYRDWASHHGATDAELARHDAAVQSIIAEERPKPGKPDPRKMDEDLFWEIIGTGASEAERLERMPEMLARFRGPEIRKFAALLDTFDAAAYRTDIWALAYLLRGGCSDDAFDSFRLWLILQGRDAYKSALENPDGFDTSLFQSGSDGFDSLASVAHIAYDLRAGKAMTPPKPAKRALTGPEVDEEDFATLLPTIAKQTEL